MLMPIHRKKPAACKRAEPATATTRSTLHRANDMRGAYNYVIQSAQYMYVNCNFQVLKNHVDQS